MNYSEFVKKLALTEKVICIKRTSSKTTTGKTIKGCTLKAFSRVQKGERLVISRENVGCEGFLTGAGITDELPDIPGGFGCFLSAGRGEDFPPGERVKKTPELAEAMIYNQPTEVHEGWDAIALSPYTEGEDYDLVTIQATPDQLSVLVHIFNYEKAAYDNVIMPMSSGCASIIRIPLGEMAKGDDARAVIGNVDVVSRVFFPANAFFFTVPAKIFDKMLANADESIMAAKYWRAVEKRILGGKE